MHGEHHFLQAVGIAVRRGSRRLGGVLADVTGGLVGRVDQADIHDVTVAGRDVPFTGEVDMLQPLGMTQDVQVGVPVGGGYRPFDFNARAATLDAATPPATPPEPPKSSVKTIQSMGERLIIRGKGKRDESCWEVAEPVAYACCGEGGAVDGAGDAPPGVTIVGPDTVLIGVLFGAIHPGIATAIAKSSDTVVRAAKSDQSRVHKLALSGPARMAKSQAKIVMI